MFYTQVCSTVLDVQCTPPPSANKGWVVLKLPGVVETLQPTAFEAGRQTGRQVDRHARMLAQPVACQCSCACELGMCKAGQHCPHCPNTEHISQARWQKATITTTAQEKNTVWFKTGYACMSRPLVNNCTNSHVVGTVVSQPHSMHS